MRELFKDAFKITNNNLILTVPLIVFIMVVNLYSMFSRYAADSLLKMLLASVTILFMFSVFCAGWFYMIKIAINLSNKIFVFDLNRKRDVFDLFKVFPEGVGKYFLPLTGVQIIFFLMQFIATPLVYLSGVKLFGSPDVALLNTLQNIITDSSSDTNAAMLNVVEKLSPEQIIYFMKWSILFMVVTFAVMYLLMLWIPEIIYKTSNPFVALWRSWVKLFKDFFKTAGLYLTLWFFGFVILFINTFTFGNPIAYIIMSIIIFYFYVYFAIVIFLYYYKKYMVSDEQ